MIAIDDLILSYLLILNQCINNHNRRYNSTIVLEIVKKQATGYPADPDNSYTNEYVIAIEIINMFIKRNGR